MIPNKRRATPSDGYSAATRRAGPLFAPRGVAARLCSPATQRSRRLADHEKRLRQQSSRSCAQVPSFEPFVDKPVAVLNASPRAHHADAALRETLKTMSAAIVESASITLPLLGAHLDEDGMVRTPQVADAISGCLAELRTFVARHQVGSGPALS